VKNVAVSQRLGLVPTTVCESAENRLAYDNIDDPAFQNLQLSDLPPLEFDNILSGMLTWSEKPTDNDVNQGCYVDNGRLIGVCTQ